ncbi:MAG: NAD+ kinase [Pseudomonadales bacterium]|jgi:NAD+ kinase
MSKFKSVGVVGRLGNDRVLESVEVLLATVSKRQLNILLHEDIASQLSSHDYEVGATDDIGTKCDLVIVVGGDGSLLSAARDLAHHDVAVLGVNRGKLGFLTDIKPEQVETKVNEVLDGKYSVEERFLLDISVSRDDEIIGVSHALNDVVVNSGRSARMIDFDLYMNDDFVYSQDSDGLIVSTPTGSTAYALSGGGPIMHPDLDAIVLVPMFPHTLSARPIVVGGNTEIKIIIGDCHPYISCDGQVHLNAAPQDVVTITKKPHKLKLVHPLDHSFYAACRTKLGWSGRLTEPKA